MKQKYDRNRTEFDSIINSLMEDIPGQKVVASIYFMQKISFYLLRFFDGSDPKSEFNQQRINRLFETMSGWMNSSSVARLGPEISLEMNESDELRRSVTKAESRMSTSFSTKWEASYEQLPA